MPGSWLLMDKHLSWSALIGYCVTLRWDTLLMATALLLTPTIVGAGVRHRLGRAAGSHPGRLPNMVRAWQNWADLARAAVGTALLIHVPARLFTDDSEVANARFLLCAAFLGIGLLVQTIRFSPRLTVIAPVFYVTGLTTTMVSFDAAGFAVLVGWAFGFVGRNVEFTLPTMGLALGVSGYVLVHTDMLLFLNIALIFGPLAISVLFSRAPRFFAADLSPSQSESV